MLVEMSMRSARASLAIAVTDCHATDDVLPLRPLRRTAMRCYVPVGMRLTTRMGLLHRLDHARRRLRTSDDFLADWTPIARQASCQILTGSALAISTAFARRFVLAITDRDNGDRWRRCIVDRDGLLPTGSHLMVLYVVTTAVFAAVVMLLHRLLLPVATCRRVPSHIARRRALFHPLLHRTQLLRLFLMLVPVLGLLRDRHVVLMMLRHATLAPTLRRMFHEGTGVVDFRDRKYWPLQDSRTVDDKRPSPISSVAQ